MSAQCNGICMTGYDIGLESSAIAYPHPNCPAHGYNPAHPFEFAYVDGHGHEYCKCDAVRSTHEDEEPCYHPTFSSGHCFDCGWKP